MSDYEKTGNGEAPWIDLPFKASLRDYFAGQSIQLAGNGSLEIMKLEIVKIRFTDETAGPELRRLSAEHIERTTRDSYVMADAMIKERNK